MVGRGGENSRRSHLSADHPRSKLHPNGNRLAMPARFSHNADVVSCVLGFLSPPRRRALRATCRMAYEAACVPPPVVVVRVDRCRNGARMPDRWWGAHSRLVRVEGPVNDAAKDTLCHVLRLAGDGVELEANHTDPSELKLLRTAVVQASCLTRVPLCRTARIHAFPHMIVSLANVTIDELSAAVAMLPSGAFPACKFVRVRGTDGDAVSVSNCYRSSYKPLNTMLADGRLARVFPGITVIDTRAFSTALPYDTDSVNMLEKMASHALELLPGLSHWPGPGDGPRVLLRFRNTIPSYIAYEGAVRRNSRSIVPLCTLVRWSALTLQRTAVPAVWRAPCVRFIVIVADKRVAYADIEEEWRGIRLLGATDVKIRSTTDEPLPVGPAVALLESIPDARVLDAGGLLPVSREVSAAMPLGLDVLYGWTDTDTVPEFASRRCPPHVVSTTRAGSATIQFRPRQNS